MWPGTSFFSPVFSWSGAFLLHRYIAHIDLGENITRLGAVVIFIYRQVAILCPANATVLEAGECRRVSDHVFVFRKKR